MSDEERERLWALIETYAGLVEAGARLDCSDAGYVSAATSRMFVRELNKARAELRRALGFAVD